MPLAAGTRLGNYEIVGPLGAGGMGEVYRATDTKLDREVAIKVLPAAFAQHSERLARFEREAKVLASLSHPNIASIYAVEESSEGKALVMELVKGQTLKGPVPVDTALKYAAQIASALDAAHEKGITHRDLKPANIMLTPDGTIKVLDFGLAAVTQLSQSDGEAGTNMVTLTMSPTSVGMIMGTAAYMSPEQARGQTVDRRADIWSFGAVLWELLTGKQLFGGDTVSDILASVLKEEPNLEQVPAKMRPLLKRSLEKDPKKRLQAIGDWELLLVEDKPAASVPPLPPSRFGWVAWCLAAIGCTAAVSLAAWILLRRVPLPEVTRFEIHAPEGSRLPFGTPAPSPDGRTMAYTVIGMDGVPRIHVRPMDSTESRALPGTENAAHPFWSPDGRSLAFIADGSLKRIDLAGGTARVLAQTNSPFQGSWNREGVILFGGPSQVPADGGVAAPIAKLDEKKGEIGIGFPHFLSDGKRFLVRVVHGDGRNSIELASLGSLERTTVIADSLSAPILAPTPGGKTYLLYLRDAALVAQEFNEASGNVTGGLLVLVSDIGRVAALGTRPTVGVSLSGILAYQTGSYAGEGTLAWFDRSGKRLSQPSSAMGGSLNLSPDGRFAAVVNPSRVVSQDIWLVDLVRGASTRFTFAPGSVWPVWSPNGKRVAFQSELEGRPGIYVKDANGAGKEQLLVAGSGKAPTSWSPDGQSILFTENLKVFLLPLAGDRKPTSAGFPSVFSQYQARISPDGKYLAFSSGEAGRPNVYVQAMPPNVGKWQISVSGGVQPTWRRDGKELFFLSQDQKMMAVDVNLGSTVTVGIPHPLFQASASLLVGQRYDVSADGQRFLMYSPDRGTENAPITVVLNWWAGLKK